MERAVRELPIPKMNNPEIRRTEKNCWDASWGVIECVKRLPVTELEILWGWFAPSRRVWSRAGWRVAPKDRQRPFGQGGVLQ